MCKSFSIEASVPVGISPCGTVVRKTPSQTEPRLPFPRVGSKVTSKRCLRAYRLSLLKNSLSFTSYSNTYLCDQQGRMLLGRLATGTQGIDVALPASPTEIASLVNRRGIVVVEGLAGQVLGHAQSAIPCRDVVDYFFRAAVGGGRRPSRPRLRWLVLR